MTSGDPRQLFLKSVAGELRCGPFTRRRVCQELAAHLDDVVAELCALGLPPEVALQEALRRLGDPVVIATSFSLMHVRRRWWCTGGRLRSPAWIAVGAMTLVTAWAAELPPASGAKPPARCGSQTPHRPMATPPWRRGGDGFGRRHMVGGQCAR